MFGPDSRLEASTLVEILAVIGILCALALFLLPTMDVVRERWQAIQCLSNLRQIGGAMFMYAADNSGHMPPYAAKTTSGTQGPYYPELLSSYLPSPKDPSYAYSKIFCCPSQGPRSADALQRRYTDFGLAGMNGIFFGVCNPSTGKIRFSLAWCGVSPNLATIPMRAQAMMLSDIGKYYIWSTDNLDDPVTQNWRHSNGINCVFADGHTEYRKRDTIPTDPQDVFWNGGNPNPVPYPNL